MIPAATIFAAIVLGGPAVGYLAAVVRYRKRLDEAEDRAELARDIAADAMTQLREVLTDEVEAGRVGGRALVHGMTGPELTVFNAADNELDADRRLNRWRKRLDRRARRNQT